MNVTDPKGGTSSPCLFDSSFSRRRPRLTFSPSAGHTMEYMLAGDFSPGAPDLLTKPVIFMLFGEHAREIITSDTALWFARAVAGAHRAAVASLVAPRRTRRHCPITHRPRKGTVVAAGISSGVSPPRRSEPLALAGPPPRRRSRVCRARPRRVGCRWAPRARLPFLTPFESSAAPAAQTDHAGFPALETARREV